MTIHYMCKLIVYALAAIGAISIIGMPIVRYKYRKLLKQEQKKEE